MAFNYFKIRIGNWLYRYAFPLYRVSYNRFKLKNDAAEIALLRSLIKPGFTVYDIGANIGFYAKLLSQFTGVGKVVCFEPDRKNFKHLTGAVSGKSNVTLFQMAASEHSGTLQIYRSKLLNVDHRTYAVNNYESVEDIESVAIDDLVVNGKIPPPDVVKIDIQGFELSAMKGMEKTLRRRAQLRILAEFWPHGFRRAGVSALEFYDYLVALGFRFEMLANEKLTPLSRDYVEQHNGDGFDFSFNVLITKG